MEELELLAVPLVEWYRENARTLPWRSEPTPYHVWVSEIMLQQTRVTAVLDYYRRFLEALPTVDHLARCPEEELMKLWQGLGYYSRARNLKKAARVIAEDYGGEFPSDYDTIRALPGVGDYTAGAISSIAFGLPHPAVDGNVLRVVARLTGDRRDVTKPETKKDITAALHAVMPLNAPGDFNQALMELGATVCLPNGAPLCDRCPAAEFCTARREGTALELPVKPPKKARRVEERTVYLIFRDGKVALRKRPGKGLLAGLWEYPNELSPWPCPVAGEVAFGAVGKHIFTHIEWRMTAYTVMAQTHSLPAGWVWADGRELRRLYALPSAFQDFTHIVEENLAL
ncbi:MAG: A/G-specific adenine glycosylase [Oscillospiraceae bacterium]|nr:A/G-specific adenine glycosylase [Oscillospiraceae bacterium]